MNHELAHDPADCRELFAQLSGYLDGELTPELRSEVESHLCGCPPCIEFVESLRRTVGLCRTFEPDAAPSPLTHAHRTELLGACLKMLANKRPQPAL